MAHELAPFLEIGRAAEIDGVVLHRLPADNQSEAAGLLDRAQQRQRPAALGALEQRRGLLHAGLEFRFQAGLYVDLRDFQNHATPHALTVRSSPVPAITPVGAIAVISIIVRTIGIVVARRAVLRRNSTGERPPGREARWPDACAG